MEDLPDPTLCLLTHFDASVALQDLLAFAMESVGIDQAARPLSFGLLKQLG